MSLQMPNDALLGIALQQDSAASDYAKLAAGYDEVVSNDANYNFYPFTDLSLAPVKNTDVLPPEIGGKALPTGEYVTGIWAEGPVSLIPRLDNRFGWLLYAACGQVSTIANAKVEDLALFDGAGAATSGVHSHIFSVVSADQYFIPWLSARRLLPHTTAGERVGEVFQDGRVAALTLAAATASPITADLTILARVKQTDFAFEVNPGWSATYDDLDDFAVASCDGHFKVAGTEFKVTAAAFNLVNQLLPPAQSTYIGSVHPLDFPNLGRVMTVTGTFLVENYDLYMSIFKGAAVDVSVDGGQNPACTVYEAELDVMWASQTAIGAAGDADEPFRLRFLSNQVDDNVSWTVRPIRIMPNRPIVAQVVGTFKAAATGYPWYMVLQNGTANYTLPAF